MNRRLLLLPVLAVGVGLLPACDRPATADPEDTSTVTVNAPSGGDEATLDRVDHLLDAVQRQVDTDGSGAG